MFYFYDWVKVYQDFYFEIPLVGKRASQNIDVETGEYGKIYQHTFQHEGSFSTSINISISGNRIEMSGNPSRYGRRDNLFGFELLDDCMSIYNKILSSLGLPVFTKCTKVIQFTEKQKGASKMNSMSDGAVFKELHITSNRAVGKGNEVDYLKGIATLPYRNSVPRLHTNGNTVDWLSKKGNATLMYPSVYNKAAEIDLRSLPKILRKEGPDSLVYRYTKKVRDFCLENGVVRFEQKIKGHMLTRLNARYWGLFDEEIFDSLHEDFLNIDKKLQVTSMDIGTIGDQLLSNGYVTTARAGNATALYALEWMHGKLFDSSKSQVRTHRARLRKIGIDICRPCNISQMSPVYVKKAVEITPVPLASPDWYRHAQVA